MLSMFFLCHSVVQKFVPIGVFRGSNPFRAFRVFRGKKEVLPMTKESQNIESEQPKGQFLVY